MVLVQNHLPYFILGSRMASIALTNWYATLTNQVHKD